MRSPDPIKLNRLIETLQQEVRQLKAEKVELLQNRNIELERLVQLRTAELQRQAERERLLSITAQRIRQSLNLQEIFDATVTEVRQLLKCDRLLVYQFDSDWNGTIMAESVGNFPSILGTKIGDTYFQRTQGREYLKGRRQVLANIYEANLSDCHFKLLTSFQVKAVLTVPIIINEQIWGLLVAHQCKDIWQWHQEELNLLEQISVHIAIAIQQAKAFKQIQTELQERQKAEIALQQLNEKLEIRVQERIAELANIVEKLHREVAERQQAEKALQESNRTINNILESITEGFFALDRDWNFTHFNSLLEPILQRPVSELIGKNIWKEFPEVIGTPFEKAYHQAVAEQKLVSFEAFYPPLNMWMEVRVYPSCDGLSVYFRDINERKKVEQVLQESQQFIQSIADSSPNILYIYDLVEKRNIYSNREIAKILGYTPEEILEMGSRLLPSLVHPDDLAKLLNHHHQFNFAQDGDMIEVEYRIRNANGEWRWLYNWDTIFMRSPDGKPKQILGTASDITTRKLTEEALNQQLERERLIGSISQRIRQSLNLETILKTTVEEVQQLLAADRVLVYQIFPDGTGSAIAEGVDPEWPSILYRLFPSETFPEDCYQAYRQGKVYVLDDRDRGGVLPCMVDFMQQFAVRAKLVVPIIQKDVLWGLLIAHQCSSPRQWQPWEIELLKQLATQLAIAIQQSQLYGQVQTELQDRQRAEEQLRQNNKVLAATNAELARATRLKDEFLANMSHELRTPLNAILGMSEGLLDELCGSLNDRQRRAIVTIEKSGRHLLEVINDILDLAKIESGKFHLQITPVPVAKLVNSSLTFVKQQAHQKNIKLTAKVPKELGTIAVDELRMRQVLINLLSNAVKFTLPDGHVTVEVKADTEDSPIELSVSDTGIGIALEDMQKLFQSFVQIDSSLSRRYEGTGLGLALVRRIVELHEGSINVESEVGKGSRFTVVLPRNKEQPEKVSDRSFSPPRCSLPIVSPQVASLDNAAIHSKQPLVLLAEDNEANIETISHYLISAGYELIVAKNGWEAVRMAQQYKPSLILMDVHMPEMDGLTATRQIRADRETATIPIITLTALAMPGDRERCLAAGASEYMKKPVSLKQLITTMKNLLMVATQR